MGSQKHSRAMRLSYLEPVPCVFTAWVSSGLTIGSDCRLAADRRQEFFSSLSCLSARCKQRWVQHPLSTAAAGNSLFLWNFTPQWHSLLALSAHEICHILSLSLGHAIWPVGSWFPTEAQTRALSSERAESPPVDCQGVSSHTFSFQKCVFLLRCSRFSFLGRCSSAL